MKTKTNLLLLALALFSFSSFAQTAAPTESSELVPIARVELGLHGLGVGYEMPLSKKWSANLSAGLGGGYSVWNNHFKSTFVLNEPVAYFRSEFKYTYNRSKRLSKSKSTLNNAGNYVAYQTKYTTRRLIGSKNSFDGPFEYLNRTLLNEVHWGIQRPLGQKFIFNMHLGLGYVHDFHFNEGQLYPAAGVQFAYIISKKGL